MSVWPFGNLQMFAYGMIMADPPWTYKNWSRAGEHKGARAQYTCMTLDDIKALPVGGLASGDSCLWLWATNPMLDQAFEVMRAWGFRFVTAGSWQKMTKHGKVAFGTGYVLRSSNEPYLIGAIGKPKFANNIRSGFMAPIREHSRKPEEAFCNAEALVPDVRRAELFSRAERPGWDTWGNEATKFSEAAA